SEDKPSDLRRRRRSGRRRGPRPSIEMRTPAVSSRPVKATLVNWLPCSLLKISGRPKRASASSSASRQNDTSMLFDSRHASTAPPIHHRPHGPTPSSASGYVAHMPTATAAATVDSRGVRKKTEPDVSNQARGVSGPADGVQLTPGNLSCYHVGGSLFTSNG